MREKTPASGISKAMFAAIYLYRGIRKLSRLSRSSKPNCKECTNNADAEDDRAGNLYSVYSFHAKVMSRDAVTTPVIVICFTANTQQTYPQLIFHQ
jgi:hypothetical protein